MRPFAVALVLSAVALMGCGAAQDQQATVSPPVAQSTSPAQPAAPTPGRVDMTAEQECETYNAIGWSQRRAVRAIEASRTPESQESAVTGCLGAYK